MSCDTSCTPNANNSNVVYNWVTNTLPTTLFPFNIYFVKIGDKITTYMTDRNANPYIISSLGGTITLTSTDGSITIDGLNIGLSQTILDSIIKLHNNFPDVQGGAAGEYYHLTELEHTKIQEIVGKDFVETVTGDLVDNTDPKNPVIFEKKDVPETVLFSCAGSTTNPDTGLLASRLLYVTDQKRNIFLEPDIVPSMFGNASSVFVDGNTQYILYFDQPASSPGLRQWGVIALDNRLVGNELQLQNSRYFQIPIADFNTTISPSVTLHAEAFDGDYLYYSTRVGSELLPTTFVKVSAKNFEDYEVVTPFNGGGIHNIELYKNYIYYIWVADDESSAHIGRIDTNLKYAEEVFPLNTDVTRFVKEQGPILIYLDEIYLFTINNTSSATKYAKFVLQVYSMTGELKRETPVIDLDPSVVTGQLEAHWMQAYNGKIIIHTATAQSILKSIIRIDAGFGVLGGDGYIQPTLEEFIISPARSLSDDNTIINGKLWLSSETSSSFPLERRLYVVDDYRDLAAIYEYDSTDYFSGGTQVIPAEKESLKVGKADFGLSNVDNTSDIDKPVSTATQTALNSKQNTLVAGTNITIVGNTISSTGGSGITNLAYTASPTNGIVTSDTGTDATIPLATTTDAGLHSPADKTKINSAIILDSASPQSVTKAWYGTQAQYDALGVYDATTEYNISITPTILSGSATLDFIATNAASSRDLTITVTGAAEGDVVALGIPATAVLADSTYTARVSATDTVTVRFNNYSAVSQNPGSGLFKIKIFK